MDYLSALDKFINSDLCIMILYSIDSDSSDVKQGSYVDNCYIRVSNPTD